MVWRELTLYSLIWRPCLVSAQFTTNTRMQCQTWFATESPDSVATHTITTTTFAPDVTIHFTSRSTSLVSIGVQATETRTRTSLATATETVTETLEGDTFLTTSTIYDIRTTTINETVAISINDVVVEPFTVAIHLVTPAGFRYLLPTDAPLAAHASSPSPAPPKETPRGLSGGDIVTSVSKHATDLATLEGRPAETDLGHVDPAMAIITGSPQPIQPRTKHKRDDLPIPASLMGLRGAIIRSSMRTPVNFASVVTCTKSFVVENVVWRPTVDSPQYVLQTPATTTVSEESTRTTTSTVLAHPASTTSSHEITFITTTTVIGQNSITATQTHHYTVSTTSTSYLACATPNILGPKDPYGSHVVNVYSRGPWNYTLYDLGFSETAEDCCIECHTMARPCLGSVFTEEQCMLILSPSDVCQPGQLAGFYVTRPWDELWLPQNRRWGDYQLSNGPCGVFKGLGVGW